MLFLVSMCVALTQECANAQSAITSARVFAELSATANTEITIENSNRSAARIAFAACDAAGTVVGRGQFSIDPQARIKHLLSNPPFSLRSGIAGAITLNASVPVRVIVERKYLNRRGESIITNLPVVSLPAPANAPSLAIPQIANSRGWKTQVVLVNPQDQGITGTLRFFSSAGQNTASIQYRIAGKSAKTFAATTAGTIAETGYARIYPSAGNGTPSGFAIVAREEGGTVVTEAAVAGTAGAREFRIFGEVIGAASHAPNSVRTGIALANLTSQPANVIVEFDSGLRTSFTVPANQHISSFIDQLPGIDSNKAASFRGMVHITTTADVVLAAMRGYWNMQGEFVTTPVPIEN